MKVVKEIKISDNGFVFNSNTGDSFSLNQTGLQMLHLISENKGFEEIREVFIERFDVDAMTFEKDFYEFCSLLKLYQIIIGEEDAEFK